MGNPVVHFQVVGKDHEKLQKFYTDLFAWEITAHGPEMGFYGEVDPKSSGIGGGVGASQDGKPRVTIYVEVPDLQAAIDKAVAMGGKVVMPILDMPGVVTMAEIADPEGNEIGLVKAGSMA